MHQAVNFWHAESANQGTLNVAQATGCTEAAISVYHTRLVA